MCIPYIKDFCTVKNIFDDLTCVDFCADPTHDSYCNSRKQAYCNNSSKIESEDRCKEWCGTHPTQCKNGIQNYCTGTKLWNDDICVNYSVSDVNWANNAKSNFCETGSNLEDHEECKTWCKQNKEKCPNSIKRKCQGEIIFTNSLCTDFCSDNQSWCNDTKSVHCNNADNVDSHDCSEFCMTHMGGCDTGMKSYCSNNPASDKCLCILSKVGKYNPLCVDTLCINKGYATNTMLESKGDSCNIVDCSQYLDFRDSIAGGDIKVSPEFIQKCGSILTQNTSSTKNTSTSSSNSKSSSNNVSSDSLETKHNVNLENTDDEPESKSSAPLIIAIVLVVLGIVTFAGVVHYSRQEEKTEIDT